MERRKFLTSAALGGAAAASGIAAPAIAQGSKTITIVSTWPRDMPGLGLSAQRLAERITRVSGGALVTEYFAAGERVGAFDAFDEVANGNAQAYIGADYYWKGKHPGMAYFTTVPFGMTYAEQTAWYRFGGGQQPEDKLKGEYGLKGLLASNTGLQMAGWFNKEIETVDDLQGLKMRIPGMGGDVMAKLGASPVSVPGGQIYENLVSGAIEATEWVGPYNDYFMKFYEAAKYYYFPGFHEPNAAISMTFNASFWSGLTDWERAIIQECCDAEYGYSYDEINALNGQYLTKMVNENGVELREFSEEIYEAFGEAAQEVFEEVRDHSPLAAEINDSYQKSLREVGGYLRISEISYANKRNEILGIGEDIIGG